MMAWISSWTSLTVFVLFFPPVAGAGAAFGAFSLLLPSAPADADAPPSSTCTLNCSRCERSFCPGQFRETMRMLRTTPSLPWADSFPVLLFSLPKTSSHLPSLERLAAVDSGHHDHESLDAVLREPLAHLGHDLGSRRRISFRGMSEEARESSDGTGATLT